MTTRFHAFGMGPTFQVKAERPFLEAVLAKVGGVLDNVTNHISGTIAAHNFRTRARSGTNLRVGQNAWCVNGGDRAAIEIGNDVVCRGILRVEPGTEATIKIGSGCYIGDDVIFSALRSITVQDEVLIAHGVQIFDNDSHPVEPAERLRDWHTIRNGRRRDVSSVRSAPVVIQHGAWIGTQAIILKGVVIGENAIVAAGAVVTRSVGSGQLVAGNPAKMIASG